MFGKPSWFRPKAIGYGLKPVTWQGWVYSLAWAGVLLVPFWALLMRHQIVEALAWLGCSVAALGYDVWQIRRGMIPPVVRERPVARHANDGIWFLAEENAGTPVATRNYHLKLKS